MSAAWIDELERFARDGAEPQPSPFWGGGGTVSWDETSIAVGDVRIEADALVSLQVSRGMGGEEVRTWMGRKEWRSHHEAHLEVRARGARLRLRARMDEARLRGLPELEMRDAVEVPREELEALAVQAIALGARLVRVNSALVERRDQGMEPARLVFANGRAAVAGPDGRWGFVNPQGQLVIPFDFDEVKAFSEGVAPVRLGSVWGYIDLYGHWLYEPRYLWADRVYRGAANVVLDTRARRRLIIQTGSLFKGGPGRVGPSVTLLFLIVPLLVMLGAVVGGIVAGDLDLMVRMIFGSAVWGGLTAGFVRDQWHALRGRPTQSRRVSLPRDRTQLALPAELPDIEP